VLGQPQLALGLAERDEQEVWCGGSDAGDQGGGFLRGQGPEWRSLRPDDLQAREAALQDRPGLGRDARSAAQQEDPPSTRGQPASQGRDEVRTRDPLRERCAGPARRPHEWRTVRDDERGGPVHAIQRGVLGGEHRVVQVGGDDDRRLPGVDQVHDRVERLLERDRSEWKPPDFDRRR
jgi:hypothetical protein